MRAEEFRKNGEMLRQLAKTASDPKDRDIWLKLADHWERLTREAELRPYAFPIGNIFPIGNGT
jgi:hypothetical protein